MPVDAYRGAGRPEAAYLTERLVDAAARDLGVSPEALRRKNFIKPKADAVQDPDRAKIYNSGEFAAHMARAQDIATGRDFGRRAAQSPRKRTGCAASGSRPISKRAATTVRRPRPSRTDADGNVTVLAGSQSSGQGHETAYAQLVAEHLDLPPERVRVIQGDTDLIATGVGTGGSSSISCGGASVAGAAQARRESQGARRRRTGSGGRPISKSADGNVRVAGTDRAVSFAAVASLAAGDAGPALDPRMPGRRRSRPIPTAPISPKSRSIPTPAHRHRRYTSSSTISA